MVEVVEEPIDSTNCSMISDGYDESSWRMLGGMVGVAVQRKG